MEIRKATINDLPFIVDLLANDAFGVSWESSGEQLPQEYLTAFEAIEKDEGQELVVMMDGDKIAGTLQLSFIPYLTYKGGLRAQIEAVRVSESLRGRGAGRFMMEWAIERARSRGAHLVQLTTDKRRPEAISFYKTLGFEASHEGMKLHL